MELGNLEQHIEHMEIERDGTFESLGFFEDGKPNQLVFIEDAKYLQQLNERTNITCVITTQELLSQIPHNIGMIGTDIPRRTFYDVHNYLAKSDFYSKPFDCKIAGTSKIDSKACIAMRSVQIGERCEIESDVVILPNATIGDDVIIRAGSVIGTEGFQFVRLGTKVMRIAHAGGVRIGDRVEIQSNSCICKSIFGGFTEIGDDTKIDNLVHIAHGVTIGKRCFIVANSLIAGSAKIGDDVNIGASVTVAPQVVVGDRASVSIGSVVTKDVPSGKRVTGNFAIDHDKFIADLKRKI